MDVCAASVVDASVTPRPLIELRPLRWCHCFNALFISTVVEKPKSRRRYGVLFDCCVGFLWHFSLSLLGLRQSFVHGDIWLEPKCKWCPNTRHFLLKSLLLIGRTCTEIMESLRNCSSRKVVKVFNYFIKDLITNKRCVWGPSWFPSGPF